MSFLYICYLLLNLYLPSYFNVFFLHFYVLQEYIDNLKQIYVKTTVCVFFVVVAEHVLILCHGWIIHILCFSYKKKKYRNLLGSLKCLFGLCNFCSYITMIKSYRKCANVNNMFILKLIVKVD